MPSADVFRPRLPLDPFAQSHVPWQLNLSTGLKPAASQVILILGEPQPKDLLALLTSSYLTRTLILLATHTPPVLPRLPLTTPGPALRILRLNQSLSVHDAGALRLVSVLEKANNAAERWRKETGGPAKPGMRERVVMFREDRRSGEFVVQEEYVYAAASAGASGAWTGLHAASTTPMRYPSPAPSLHASSPLASSTHTPDSSRDVSPFASPAHSISSRTSLALFTASSTMPSTPNATRRSRLSSLASTSSNSKSPQTHHLKSTAPSTRVFDAIINFLPMGVQDKALLKHAILVTTLGARYLDPDPSSSSSFGSGTPAWNPPSSLPSSSSLSASSSHRPYSTLSAFSASTFSPGSTSRPVSTSLSPPNATASKKRFSLFSFGSSVDLSNAHGTVEGEVEEDFALLAQRRGKERESRGSFVGGGSMRQRLSMFLGVGSSSSSINEDSGNTHERRQRLDHTQSQQMERKVAPHIVHVLPHGWSDPSSSHSQSSSNPRLRQQREQEKPKLVQGIEQFLLSFAYPLGGLGMSGSDSGSGGSSGGRPPSHYSTHSSRAREAINANAPRPPPSAFHPSHSFSNANSHATFSQSGSLSRGGMSASAPAISTLAGPPIGGTNGGGGGVLAQLQARAVPYVVGSGVFGALIGSSSSSSSSSPSSGPSAMRAHRRRGSAESSLSTTSAEDTTTTNVDGPHGREREEALTHGEAILLGLLDYDPSSGSAGGSGRAWVRGGDVWIEGAGEEVVGSQSQSRSPTLPPIPTSVQLGLGLETTTTTTTRIPTSTSTPTTHIPSTTTEKGDKGKGKSKSETKRPQLPTPPESGSGSSSSSESGSSRSSSVEVEDVVDRAEGNAHNARGTEKGVEFTLTEPTPLSARFVVPRPSSSKLVKGAAQRPAGAGAFPRRSVSESSGGSPTDDDDEERIKGLPTKPRTIHLSDAHYQHRAPLSASAASVAGAAGGGGSGMGAGSGSKLGALLGDDLAALGATHGEKARSTSALEIGSRSMEVGVSINGVSSGGGERRKEKRGYGITSAFRKIGFGIWKKEGAGVKMR